MTSSIDLCNMALGEISAKRTINSFDDASAEAVNCKLFYTDTRQCLLRASRWGFARAQSELTLIGTLTDNTSVYPWGYKYRFPPEAAAIRYLLQGPQTVDAAVVLTGDPYPFWGNPTRNNRFLVAYDGGEKVVLSNVTNALAVYTQDLDIPDMFDPLFRRALVASLAGRLAMPLSGSINLRNQQYAIAQAAVDEAKVADGNEAVPTTDHTPDWMLARSAGPRAGYGFPGTSPFDLGYWFEGQDALPWGS